MILKGYLCLSTSFIDYCILSDALTFLEPAAVMLCAVICPIAIVDRKSQETDVLNMFQFCISCVIYFHTCRTFIVAIISVNLWDCGPRT